MLSTRGQAPRYTTQLQAPACPQLGRPHDGGRPGDVYWAEAPAVRAAAPGWFSHGRAHRLLSCCLLSR